MVGYNRFAEPRVAKWYEGRTILITGGTGFMGKVLVEKLLRSCPGVKRILVLARSKRGVDPRTRLQHMKQLPLFELLRTKTPEVFEKLQAIDSDITVDNLGLSEADRNLIKEEVSVVFHCAASLRLEAGLKAAVQNNTISTLRLLELAEEIKHLEVFMHLSTAFCHCDLDEVGEEIYPDQTSPHDIIGLMSWMDEKDIEMITPTLLGPHPNSYTFSKRLAETLVQEKAATIPVVIARPSIVLPTLNEPISGWVDTLNGPIGLMVGAGKGVIRSMMAGEDIQTDMIPVDIAINGLITAAWKVATDEYDPNNIPVYNITQGQSVPMTYGQILDAGRQILYENPFEGAVWYPDGGIRTSRLMHNLCVLFFHILPAYLIDFIMILIRQKRFMVRLQSRISVGLEVLQYFTMRTWKFRCGRVLDLEADLCLEDQQIFYLTKAAEKLELKRYMKDCLLGARQYCMKEPLSSLPKARRHMKMLYVIDRVTALLFYTFCLWLLFHAVTWFSSTVCTWQAHLPMLRPAALLNPMAAS